MLPATLAQEVKKQLRHYLEATFPMRRPEMEAALGQFLHDPENGIFKGPWLQLRRPFRTNNGDVSGFFDLEVPFTPFKHQYEAWQRLHSRGQSPKPTIVTTGTGSGKTECFLYPLLDHCLREHKAGRAQGIKAIVLYPMNALAADQAGRFAEEILKSDQLSGLIEVNGVKQRKAKVTVGLYTGRMQPGQEDQGEGRDHTYREVQMLPPASPDGKPVYVAMTNREAMQENPPDILLTNYKMLDYLLMRPKDQGIWQFNQDDPALLRYLVLDELHTYDGAQGADVACLIRRLKERLGLARGELCVVGTSATVAGGEEESRNDPLDRLCDFAKSLFEERITNDAVILEDRLSIREVLTDQKMKQGPLPTAAACQPEERESAQDFARRMAPLFGAPAFPLERNDQCLRKLIKLKVLKLFDLVELVDRSDISEEVKWALALAKWLRVQPLFKSLLTLTEDGVVRWDKLVRTLAHENILLREAGGHEERSTLVMAFLVLVAQARELRSGRAFPLVPTQVQLWLRELRRVGLVVAEKPRFNWLDQPFGEHKQLPVAHCSECGEVAWVALRDPDRDSEIQQTVSGFALIDDVQKIYQGWGFEHQPSEHLVILSPWQEGDEPMAVDGQQELEGLRHYLSPSSLVVRVGEGECPLTGDKTFAVKLTNEQRLRENNKPVGVQRCPHCQTERSLMFIGSQAATIASVAIDEVFGSTLNSDPKLLAFTDSVQDASHRAGFFSARTYNFTFRTALQHVVDEAGDAGLGLEEVGEALLRYWSQPLPGRPGCEREVMATLMPPDLREYAPWLAFRNNPTQLQPPPNLRQAFVERLNWQATSEFSLMMTHGRTMEANASATLGWQADAIAATIAQLRERLPGISPVLEAVSDAAIGRWSLGILHRARLRGALFHPYLEPYARQNYWGKYPFGKVVEGREVFPPAGKYKPRLIVTQRDKYHEHLLAPSSSNSSWPWQLVWAQRVLLVPGLDDASLLDLLAAWLEAAERGGLLRLVHRDGEKGFYALNHRAARLFGEGQKLASCASGETLFRPQAEAQQWRDGPTLGYRDDQGRYRFAPLSEREQYYKSRYRKGALRRVFAFEHTGLLTTEEREALEMQFNAGGHKDDPNVLTATSTLEMGIDIGDLSTTMLCSVPPTVASYLQRIGRAGRRTGTALVLSVINQRPHDLFFYARPGDLLNGAVEPPGCWLDATAVIVRQYLAFCFDTAVAEGVLTELPRSGRQLVEEVLVNQAGSIPNLIAWMTEHEATLQRRFIQRFAHDFVDGSGTSREFMEESRSALLEERIERAATEFNLQNTLLRNARNRLSEQKKKLDPKLDGEALGEIEREQKILTARTRKLGEISALEVLTEHGLLPNYAFPERGVRFSGTTYNQHAAVRAGADGMAREERLKSYEIVRSGSAAIRELAPANRFYTHSHVFDVQQLELGSKSQPLLEQWAVCGQCGHMRSSHEVSRPEATPNCPQCGYDGMEGQTDLGQHRACLPFHRSQAISYMEFYQSLSADRGEERERGYYQLVTSFDHAQSKVMGAVGEDELPFGIEYRAGIRMRELNTGYGDQGQEVAFGQDHRVPDGFEVCSHCGVVVGPGESRFDASHRKSCSGRLATEAKQRKGQSDSGYQWQRVWLYRELRSEAIRLLLPDVEQADFDTLEAAIYLGMRLRFQGDPAHLLVKTQVIPDHARGITRNYLVLMDAVPGGTGFLKTLYKASDGAQREGEGVVEVLTLARNALEACECRRPQQDGEETDGCYRCIRTYHMQHRAQNISRERGIELLGQLIEAAGRREVRRAIDGIKPDALYKSLLERRFVERLRSWVEGRQGKWLAGMTNDKRRFGFLVGSPERSWELELQPLLGSEQGVAIACQPDFLLRCDDAQVKPLAIFTDGFEFHVQPHQERSRLADDVQKRRAILESGQFWVWSLSWDDVERAGDDDGLAFLHAPVVENALKKIGVVRLKEAGLAVPDVDGVGSDPWLQLLAFVECPLAASWGKLAQHAAGVYMNSFATQGLGVAVDDLRSALDMWRSGYAPPPISGSSGDWMWLSSLALSGDMLAYALADELITSNYAQLHIALRLEDSLEERNKGEAFKLRWRQFLAMLNLFQFSPNFSLFAVSEVLEEIAPDLPIELGAGLSEAWQEVLEEVASSIEPMVRAMAAEGGTLPEVEYYCDDVCDGAFAELAWPGERPPRALLIGDQASFASKWQAAGWTVITK
jgi:DEAD/DEAH box helicase domain-containing protein